MKTLTINQQAIHNFLLTGAKIIQKNNKLFMAQEPIKCNVWTSYMFKMYGSSYCAEMKNFIIIKEK